MTPEEIAQWSALAGQISGNGLLVLAIIGLLRGWVVTKWHYDAVAMEHDQQLAFLLRLLEECHAELRERDKGGLS